MNPKVETKYRNAPSLEAKTIGKNSQQRTVQRLHEHECSSPPYAGFRFLGRQQTYVCKDHWNQKVKNDYASAFQSKHAVGKYDAKMRTGYCQADRCPLF
jgi:hypothetical protein